MKKKTLVSFITVLMFVLSSGGWCYAGPKNGVDTSFDFEDILGSNAYTKPLLRIKKRIWMSQYAPAYAPPSDPNSKTMRLTRYDGLETAIFHRYVTWWYDKEQHPPEYSSRWEEDDGFYYIYEFLVTPKGLLYSGYKYHDPDGNIMEDASYDPPWISQFPFGYKQNSESWAGVSIKTSIYPPNSLEYKATEIQKFTVLGIETVTVPAGTFYKCLKLYRIRSGQIRVQWYARGLGLIKSVSTYTLGSYGYIYELESYELNSAQE